MRGSTDRVEALQNFFPDDAQLHFGQTIAHAGMTGSVTAPQVHFELRKGAKPVNPLDYLAGA